MLRWLSELLAPRKRPIRVNGPFGSSHIVYPGEPGYPEDDVLGPPRKGGSGVPLMPPVTLEIKMPDGASIPADGRTPVESITFGKDGCLPDVVITAYRRLTDKEVQAFHLAWTAAQKPTGRLS